MNEKYTIYGLFNPIDNSCFYVGQTIKNLSDRLKQHISNKKTNYYKRLVIEDIHSKGLKPYIEEIITIEDYFIDELGIYYWQFAELYVELYCSIILHQPLTNIATPGSTCRNNKCNKRIKQFDLYNNYIKTFTSTSTAARSFKDKDFNTAVRMIGDCCRGKQQTAYGFQWCFDGQEDKIVNDVSILRKNHVDISLRLKIKEDNKKQLYLKKEEERNRPEAIEERRLKRNNFSRQFNKTEAGKLSKKKYYQTPEGKEKKRLEKLRYNQSDKGKEAKKREMLKRKERKNFN